MEIRYDGVAGREGKVSTVSKKLDGYNTLVVNLSTRLKILDMRILLKGTFVSPPFILQMVLAALLPLIKGC